jgi:putative hydrolase of the HAD superfamily
MAVKAVIFDYGNVLTFPQPENEIKAMAELLQVEKEEFLRAYYSLRDLYDTGTIDGKAYWQKVSEALRFFSLEEKITEKLIDLDLLSWFSQNRQVWDLVLKLKKEYKTALLSNNIHELVGKMEREIELDRYFDVLVFSNRLPFLKPDPKIYLYCLKKLKVAPAESVFIDDKIKNVEAANNLGIKGILFESGQKLVKDLELILGKNYDNDK